MKSFKEYLTESKKVYEFKIKVAGDCPKDCATKIKEALATYKVESCSGGKNTPITEKQVDFPKMENVEVTLFDVVLSYPTNTVEVREAVATKLKMPQSKIRVRNMAEEAELALNHEFDETTEPVLGHDYPASNNQGLVGEQYVMDFLKSLSQQGKKEGYAVEGANEKLFPKTGKSKAQSEQSVKEQQSRSPVAKSPEDVTKKVF